MDKGELKAAVVHDIGNKVDDMLEAARADAASKLGANVALLACSKKVAELAAHVDKDFESGAFEGLEPPAIAQAIKKYITRACAVIDSGAEAAARARLVADGKIQMAELMVGNLRKIHDAELAKSAARQQAEQVKDAAPSDGGRPPLPLKERRLAEEKAAATPKPARKARAKKRS